MTDPISENSLRLQPEKPPMWQDPDYVRRLLDENSELVERIKTLEFKDREWRHTVEKLCEEFDVLKVKLGLFPYDGK